MAKSKKVGTPVEAVAEPLEKTRGDLKPVRLDLPSEVHRMLRIVAAHDGVSMASYARDALATHLTEETERRGLGGR